jgi:hypothetical protein
MWQRMLEAKVTDAGLKELASLNKQLQSLDLEGAHVTDAGLKELAGLTGLKQLQSLNLGFCQNVTDAGLEHLAGLKQLQMLYLNSTGVTDRGVADLKKALPNLKIER